MAASEYLRSLSPRTKAALLAVVVIGVAFFIAATFFEGRDKHPRTRAKEPAVNVVQPARTTGIESVNAELNELRRQQKQLQDTLERLKRTQGDGSTLPGPANIAGDLLKGGPENLPPLGEAALPSARPPAVPPPAVTAPETPEATAQQSAPPEPPKAGAVTAPPLAPQTSVFDAPVQEPKPVPPSASANAGANANGATTKPVAAAQPPVEKRHGIRVVNASGDVTDSEGAGGLTPASLTTAESAVSGPAEAFIPAGAMFSGVFLNGLDAPTSGTAKENPTPIVLRVKREALLPNNAWIDVSECFLLASGYGQLATERAVMRSETLSCVRNDGKVIQSAIDAYLVGPDGKVGIPGRLVSKQGQLIAKGLIAGTLGGLGQALNRTRVPSLNIDPERDRSLYQSDSVSAIAQSGIAGGIETTATMIAKFYLDMAKEMFPVVEVPAGVTATVVVTSGVSLPLHGSQSLSRYAAATKAAPPRDEQNQPARAVPVSAQANRPVPIGVANRRAPASAPVTPDTRPQTPLPGAGGEFLASQPIAPR